MKMQTADERFDYSVWYVLDKIREAMLPDKTIVSYLFDTDITRQSPISFWRERKALKYLISNGVMREIGERVTIESGRNGSTNYSVQEQYSYRVNKKQISKYYKYFYLKVFSKKPNEQVVKVIKTQISELIKVRKIGKKQTKLLTLLSNLKAVSRSTLESKTNTKDLTALIRDTRKSIESSAFDITLVRSNTISKENSYKLDVTSLY